jgi:transposase-like protein
MIRCVSCSGINLRVIRSQLTLAGHRRRRWHCNGCSHRWTTFEENAAPPRERRKPRPRIKGCRSLTNAEAAAIMLSAATSRVLAAEYGMTRQAILAIKSGRHYRDVYAALGLNCNDCSACRFWDKGCSFGFPEAGGDFSKHCTLFESQEDYG